MCVMDGKCLQLGQLFPRRTERRRGRRMRLSWIVRVTINIQSVHVCRHSECLRCLTAWGVTELLKKIVESVKKFQNFSRFYKFLPHLCAKNLLTTVLLRPPTMSQCRKLKNTLPASAYLTINLQTVNQVSCLTMVPAFTANQYHWAATWKNILKIWNFTQETVEKYMWSAFKNQWKLIKYIANCW